MERTKELILNSKKTDLKEKQESGAAAQGQQAFQGGATDFPWIQVAPDAPYFITEEGENWTPIGQNDAITWPDFANAFRRKDLKQVEDHLAWLSEHGVTCLRFMLEYAQTENRYFERPAGTFSPNMVRLWDDLFELCGKYKLRILLTPVDTFWMWIRWKHHPYNKKNGGPCSDRPQWLLCTDTRKFIKDRITFVAERWGGSGVLFAWDLWNEIHPAHANNRTDVFHSFIKDISEHLREIEMRLYGRSHPQTVSLYGPVLDENPEVADAIFRHPNLDFATTHFYDAATINNPKDTLWSAIVTGRLVREALEHVNKARPFFDSEHGPIHAFKDRKKTLPEPFDDEYFRHMQWAHFASGGAGGGMRWPNRHPHVLTHGMRRAQKSMAAFASLIDWKHFRRKNLNYEVQTNTAAVTVFACADEEQAVVWVLRTDTVRKREGTFKQTVPPIEVGLKVPGMSEGKYRFTMWSTAEGRPILQEEALNTIQGSLSIVIPAVVTDIALAIRKIG
ncbi:glycoside hydrolase 5 family protein [Pontibacter diazotrophicus]|uniref:hypothetical protein n=1 Tax=Pontibacter diazotrophicus TaxID=1400979 RepID=UPI0015F19B42|nr:hypothetical protein [Pontibacter diazotrophicus]